MEQYSSLQLQKDSIITALERSGADVVALKRRSHNERVAELVTNSNEIQKIVFSGNRLVRKDTPVFHIPDNRFGRAHFFAPVKKLGNLEIDTVKFNVMILWLMTLILYFALRYDLLRKLIGVFDKSKK